jgi:hypothetical protein
MHDIDNTKPFQDKHDDVGSSMLVASLLTRCRRQPACQGHEPNYVTTPAQVQWAPNGWVRRAFPDSS